MISTLTLSGSGNTDLTNDVYVYQEMNTGVKTLAFESSTHILATRAPTAAEPDSAIIEYYGTNLVTGVPTPTLTELKITDSVTNATVDLTGFPANAYPQYALDTSWLGSTDPDGTIAVSPNAQVGSWQWLLSASGTTINDIGTGANTLIAGGANMTIHGNGNEVVVFTGTQSQYGITATAANGANGITVTDTGTSRTSADQFNGVLQLKFSDHTVTIAANHSLAESVALLYQGALGRSPDQTGLLTWNPLAAALPASAQAMGVYALSDVSANYNGTLSIAGGFTNSTEFVTKYGSLTNDQYVTQLYTNILDRAPDATGYATWMGELNAGFSREHVLVGFAESVEAIGNATNGYTGQSGAHAAWLFLA